tara:strand:+ start:14910 stop:17018 length:2109 start_codon:yes stop_codon:yes gene_type:complete
MPVRLGDTIGQLGDSDTYRLVKGKDVDLTEADLMGSDLADADLVLIDDGAAGTQASTKKSALSRFFTYISGKLAAVTDVSSYSWVLDEDNLSSDSDTKVPTQQSVKAYVDAASVSGTVDYLRMSMSSDVLKDGTNQQDFTGTSNVTVKFDTQDDVSGGGLTSNTTTHRITVNSAGYYRLTANMSFHSTSARATPAVRFNRNGSDIDGESMGYIRASTGNNEATANVTRVIELSANDYIEVCCHDESTATGSIFAEEAIFEVEKIQTGAQGPQGIQGPAGSSATAGNGIDVTAGEVSADLKANGGLVFEGAGNELAVDLGASSITGTLPVSNGGTGATSLTNDGVLTGGGTSAITSESNVKVSQGKLHVSNATSSASGGIRFLEAADNGTAYTTLQAAADNLNSNPVITMPASTGTMALTSDIPVHTAGDGLTLTGVDFDIDAAQTTITSVLNANLKIGTAASDEYIDFGAQSNVIRMAVNNSAVLDVLSSGVQVTGDVEVNGGLQVSGTNNLICNGRVGDTANNDVVTFEDDGQISFVTNNVARLTASDTGVSASNINVSSELNSKKNIFEKTGNSDFTFQGDVVKIGTGSTTQGELCYYKSDGSWGAADADAVATSGGCLLAIALGTDPDSDGMLLRGMFTLDHDPGTIADELYVSTTAGDITSTAPSGNGDIVRIVGYCLDSSNGQIWFNPSNDYIEITA